MSFLTNMLERFWFGCGGHCHGHGHGHGHGDGTDSCPLMKDGGDPTQRLLDPEVRRYSEGGLLVGSCAAVFLLPLVSALAGAWAAGRLLAVKSGASLGWWQFAGMLLGLAVGAAIAKGLLMLVSNQRKDSAGGGE
ncbi:MAG: hypothetical protein PVJ57_10170 [Phycisphaerae bacterium]|jgi:hypothetical protein